MEDKDKTKEQLIEELAELRQGTMFSQALGGMANDLNNVLTVIVGHVSLAKLYLTEQGNSTKALESLSKADEGCSGAVDLVRQLHGLFGGASAEPKS